MVWASGRPGGLGVGLPQGHGYGQEDGALPGAVGAADDVEPSLEGDPGVLVGHEVLQDDLLDGGALHPGLLRSWHGVEAFMLRDIKLWSMVVAGKVFVVKEEVDLGTLAAKLKSFKCDE